MTAICRTCLQRKNTRYFALEETLSSHVHLTIRNTLLSCFPELDMDVVSAASICNTCYIGLRFTYLFKNRCRQTEQVINGYKYRTKKYNIVNLEDVVEENSVNRTSFNIHDHANSQHYSTTSQSQNAQLERETSILLVESINSQSRIDFKRARGTQQRHLPCTEPEKKRFKRTNGIMGIDEVSLKSAGARFVGDHDVNQINRKSPCLSKNLPPQYHVSPHNTSKPFVNESTLCDVVVIDDDLSVYNEIDNSQNLVNQQQIVNGMPSGKQCSHVKKLQVREPIIASNQLTTTHNNQSFQNASHETNQLRLDCILGNSLLKQQLMSNRHKRQQRCVVGTDGKNKVIDLTELDETTDKERPLKETECIPPLRRPERLTMNQPVFISNKAGAEGAYLVSTRTDILPNRTMVADTNNSQNIDNTNGGRNERQALGGTLLTINLAHNKAVNNQDKIMNLTGLHKKVLAQLTADAILTRVTENARQKEPVFNNFNQPVPCKTTVGENMPQNVNHANNPVRVDNNSAILPQQEFAPTDGNGPNEFIDLTELEENTVEQQPQPVIKPDCVLPLSTPEILPGFNINEMRTRGVNFIASMSDIFPTETIDTNPNKSQNIDNRNTHVNQKRTLDNSLLSQKVMHVDNVTRGNETTRQEEPIFNNSNVTQEKGRTIFPLLGPAVILSNQLRNERIFIGGNISRNTNHANVQVGGNSGSLVQQRILAPTSVPENNVADGGCHNKIVHLTESSNSNASGQQHLKRNYVYDNRVVQQFTGDQSVDSAEKLRGNQQILNHRRKKTYECGTCNFNVMYKRDLKKHVETHFLDRSVDVRNNLSEHEHITDIGAPGNGSYTQTFEAATYMLESLASSNIPPTHINPVDQQNTNVISRNSITQTANVHVDHHIDSTALAVTSAEEILYKCALCDFSALSRKSIKIHQKHTHCDRLYTCDQCNYCAAGRQNFRVHKKTHTFRARYECANCSYRVTSKASLIKHVHKHLIERPHKCAICEYEASSYDDLRQHLYIHTNEKSNPCSLSDEGCIRNETLEGQSLQCKLCAYTTTAYDQLETHVTDFAHW